MPRIGAALLSVSALATITACTADKPDAPALEPLGPSVTAPPIASGATTIDPGRLRSAILGTADLPAGFAPIADPTEDLGLAPAPGPTESSRSRTQPAACAAVLEPIAEQQSGSTAHALGRFGGPDYTSIDIDAATYPEPAVAQAFSRVQDVIGQCLSFTGTDFDGVAVDSRIGGLDQPPAGDASTAFRVVTDSDGVTLTSDVVIAVVGSTVVQIAATGQRAIDAAVLTDIAKRQVDRLRVAPGT